MSRILLEPKIGDYITGANDVQTLINGRFGFDNYVKDVYPYIQAEFAPSQNPELDSCSIYNYYSYQFRLVSQSYAELRDLADKFNTLMEFNRIIPSITTIGLIDIDQEINTQIPNDNPQEKQHIFQYRFKLQKNRA